VHGCFFGSQRLPANVPTRWLPSNPLRLGSGRVLQLHLPTLAAPSSTFVHAATIGGDAPTQPLSEEHPSSKTVSPSPNGDIPADPAPMLPAKRSAEGEGHDVCALLPVLPVTLWTGSRSGTLTWTRRPSVQMRAGKTNFSRCSGLTRASPSRPPPRCPLRRRATPRRVRAMTRRSRG